MSQPGRRPSFPNSDAPPLEAERLWAAHTAGMADAREALFNFYAPFAQRIAKRRLSRAVKPTMDLLELNQLAFAGLLEAIDGFDPGHGVPFEGFAVRRIAGSILDGLAKHTEVGEQIAFRRRLRRQRVHSVAEPVDDNASAADNLTALAEAAISLALGFMLEGTGLYMEPVNAVTTSSAYDTLAWKDAIQRLSREVERLPDREQSIVRRHYLEGMSFEQIASLSNLSKGRISQLHRQALGLLRTRLKHDANLFLTR